MKGGFIAACALVALQAAHAQQEPWCGEHPYDPMHPLAWENLEPRVLARIDNLEISEAYDLIVDAFEQRLAFLGDASPDRDRAAVGDVREALYLYLARIRQFGGETPDIWRENLIPGSANLLYELGPLEPGDVARIVSIPCVAFAAGTGDSSGRTVGYLVRTMRLAGIARDRAAGAQAATAIATRTYQSYEDLLYRGLPMWPWELKLNERFIPERFDMPAPDRQLVVMRPNLSLALLFDGSESSEADYALTLEPIGFVKYRSSVYTEWWGASLLVGMTDDNGRGYGALFRWDDYTFGLARHKRAGSDDDWLLYISIDLYDRVLGEDRRTNSASAFLTGIKERIQENVSASPGP